MLELIQEIVVYSLVIMSILTLGVWWEQTWNPALKLSKEDVIANIVVIFIVVGALMLIKGIDT